MMNRILLTGFGAALMVAVIAVLTTSSTSGQDEAKREYDTLTASYVEKGPDLSAELTDSWKKLDALKVPTLIDNRDGPTVELRAQYDDEYIYLFAVWADETESFDKQGWIFSEDKWTRLQGDEDRLAFAFNINSPLFATDGCTGVCHYGAFRVTEEQGKIDLWHWKAARGGRFTYADDQRLTDAVEDARGDDEGKGAYTSNKNADSTGPARIWKKDADRKGAFNEDTTMEVPADWTPSKNYNVPSYLLRQPEGSRADVQARATYKEGHWYVMLKRKLDTAQTDDAKFTPGEEITFAISVFDNTGTSTGDEHAMSPATKLKLKARE